MKYFRYVAVIILFIVAQLISRYISLDNHGYDLIQYMLYFAILINTIYIIIGIIINPNLTLESMNLKRFIIIVLIVVVVNIAMYYVPIYLNLLDIYKYNTIILITLGFICSYSLLKKVII